MMVRQMKEDAKGKSEEELAECFRVFDRCIGGLRAEAGAEQSEIGPQGTKVLGVGVPGVRGGVWRGQRAPACPESRPVPPPEGTQTATSMRRSWLRSSGPLGSM